MHNTRLKSGVSLKQQTLEKQYFLVLLHFLGQVVHFFVTKKQQQGNELFKFRSLFVTACMGFLIVVETPLFLVEQNVAETV